jgi:DNA-binding HxlR family transcriptional regulator
MLSITERPIFQDTPMEQFLCPVDEAARIIGQKWTLQIVHHLLGQDSRRFCELQEALGGVNPSTLSSRLKMLEEAGLVDRMQVSAIPPHVEYRLTPKGVALRGVIAEITRWSNSWLCAPQAALESCCGGCGGAPAPVNPARVPEE